MGKELEFKLLLPSEEALHTVKNDAHIASLCSGPWLQTQMKTTYFDTPERLFSARHFTLRQRFEGEKSIVCLKTPLKESHARGEWQIEATSVDTSAIERLVALGAPLELVLLYSEGNIAPVCGAEFLRHHVMLTFCDGSQAELACDHGFVHGRTERLPFTELELELYKGEIDEMLKLVRYLCETYSLREQPLSKYARARVLK